MSVTKKDLNSVRLEFEIRFRNNERALQLFLDHFTQRNLVRFWEMWKLEERCEELEKMIKKLANSKNLKINGNKSKPTR